MNFTLKPVALAMLVAAAALAGTAGAQTQKSPAAQVGQSTLAGAPIAPKAPQDWIVYDDTTYTPVLDPVSRHLDAALKAFDAKDNKKAAGEMRAVAEELKQQAARAGERDRALMRADEKFAQDVVKRMNASAQKVNSAAAAIESGRIKTKTDLYKVIDKAARADMGRRWLVIDAATWYPVSEEPQRHFSDAIAAYAGKDYKAAAADIRKAAGYVRLEAGRATGAAKRELDSSVARLDRLAATVESGAAKDEQSMASAFSKADYALASGHRVKAAESWANKQYDEAGYELKAAAQGLEGAAGWAGGEAKAGASATVAETRALGDRLASGAIWTQDEVGKGLESLGKSIHALGRKIGSTQ